MPISALYNLLLKKVHKMQSNVTPLAAKLSKSVIFLSVALPSANFSGGKGGGGEGGLLHYSDRNAH